MPINIGTKPAVQPPTEQASPHAEAAATIETEITQTTITDAGGPNEKETVTAYEHSSQEVQHTVAVPELMDVSMNFKMPVADYTIIGYAVRRVVPFDPNVITPDQQFEDQKNWIETTLNDLIKKQQEMMQQATA